MIGNLAKGQGHTAVAVVFSKCQLWHCGLMLSSFVAQRAFLKVSEKQWMLKSVRQLDVFCDLAFF